MECSSLQRSQPFVFLLCWHCNKGFSREPNEDLLCEGNYITL
uniref:Uncharacterized protein n=1 Tax=Rhizophora mucronata TaxID=61149 RepID=A0A2P2QHW5_RHIMU